MNEESLIKTVGVTTDTPLDLGKAFGSGGLSLTGADSSLPAEPQAITPEALAPVAPINVPTKTSLAFSSTQSLASDTAVQTIPPQTQVFVDRATEEQQALEKSLEKTQEQIVGEGLVNSIFEGQGLLRGESAERAKQFELAQVAKQRRELQDINSKVLQLDAEIRQDDTKLIANQRAEEVRDTLLPFARSAQAKLAGDAAIIRALKTSEKGVLIAQAMAKQGDIGLAIDEANAAVDAKYAPYKEDLAVWKSQLETIQPTLDAQERAQAAELLRRQEEADDEIKRQEEFEKERNGLAIKAAGFAAPGSVVSQMLNADSIEEAIAAGYRYMQSPNDKADLAYKLAQTAKIAFDMENDQNLGIDLSQSLAYAQQYASTGQIPTGLPKGTFGIVAQYAKEMPKQKGELVSATTGVRSSTLGTEEQDDIKRLYNITQDVIKLKELDKKRMGGIVAGSFGKALGSNDQAEYLTLRKAIVDNIARMQSGAALTQEEVDFYEEFLPGRFSEPLGFGQDSQKKIENFESVMNSRLRNSLGSNGLAIYGYSDSDIKYTDPQGNEVTAKVGDIIKNAEGVPGRVNADNTITLIQ